MLAHKKLQSNNGEDKKAKHLLWEGKIHTSLCCGGNVKAWVEGRNAT